MEVFKLWRISLSLVFLSLFHLELQANLELSLLLLCSSSFVLCWLLYRLFRDRPTSTCCVSLLSSGFCSQTNVVITDSASQSGFISCKLPSGAGTDQSVLLVVEGVPAASKNLVSYADPVIDRIEVRARVCLCALALCALVCVVRIPVITPLILMTIITTIIIIIIIV